MGFSQQCHLQNQFGFLQESFSYLFYLFYYCEEPLIWRNFYTIKNLLCIEKVPWKLKDLYVAINASKKLLFLRV